MITLTLLFFLSNNCTSTKKKQITDFRLNSWNRRPLVGCQKKNFSEIDMLAVDDTQRRSGTKIHWFWGGLMFFPARTSIYGTNENCSKHRLRELGRRWVTYVAIIGQLNPIKICAVPRSNTRERRSGKPSLQCYSSPWSDLHVGLGCNQTDVPRVWILGPNELGVLFVSLSPVLVVSLQLI